MDATTYDRRDEGWEPYDAPQDEQPLPRRPRRQFFNKRSAALVAVVTCAIGFYAGVSIEKGQVSNSGTITLPGTTGTGGAAATGARSGAAGTRAGGSGLAALFGGGGFAGGAAGGSGTSFGTISGVKGNTLYVTASTGNVTKVKLSSATKITKSLGVKRSSLHPGDTVVIRGLKNSGGTVVAASVSDSGAGAGGLGAAGGGSSSSSGSTGSGSSAVGSLFSSGG
ncbi:MAG: DUF5666 domain-containing protein [Solirubrobacteraceae bacterium]